MAAPIFSPLNDFGVIVNVMMRDNTTGVIAAVSTGSVTGFVTAVASGLPLADATTYDAGWSVAGVYVGASGGDLVAGDWFFPIDAAAITVALARAAFSSGATPYFIAQRTSGFRRYVKCKYLESDAADAA